MENHPYATLYHELKVVERTERMITAETFPLQLAIKESD